MYTLLALLKAIENVLYAGVPFRYSYTITIGIEDKFIPESDK